jgi:hypothetical protein
MSRAISRGEAVAVLVDTIKRERQPNVREFRRLIAALSALGFNVADMRQACRAIDICRSDGRPWSTDLAAHVPWSVEAPAGGREAP